MRIVITVFLRLSAQKSTPTRRDGIRAKAGLQVASSGARVFKNLVPRAVYLPSSGIFYFVHP